MKMKSMLQPGICKAQGALSVHVKISCGKRAQLGRKRICIVSESKLWSFLKKKKEKNLNYGEVLAYNIAQNQVI